MKFKDHSCFNGNCRILNAAISRNGASSDRVTRSVSNFRARTRASHRALNRVMQDSISRLSYEGALGRRGIDLGSLVLYLRTTAQAANLGNRVHLGPERSVFVFELGHAD